MAANHLKTIMMALGAAAVLAGCSPGPSIDRIPEGAGGLPAGTPARSATTYQYPAVHDMPPARANPPMSEEEQVKLERELAKLRDQQAREATEDPDKKPDGSKKPAAKAAAAKTEPKKKKTPDTMISLPPAGTATKP